MNTSEGSVAMIGRWYEPEEVMRMCHISRQSFNRMCRDRLWKCKKMGRKWLVHASEFE